MCVSTIMTNYFFGYNRYWLITCQWPKQLLVTSAKIYYRNFVNLFYIFKFFVINISFITILIPDQLIARCKCWHQLFKIFAHLFYNSLLIFNSCLLFWLLLSVFLTCGVLTVHHLVIFYNLCALFHVHYFMCIISCVLFQLHYFICIISCVLFRVHYVMCNIFSAFCNFLTFDIFGFLKLVMQCNFFFLRLLKFLKSSCVLYLCDMEICFEILYTIIITINGVTFAQNTRMSDKVFHHRISMPLCRK